MKHTLCSHWWDAVPLIDRGQYIRIYNDVYAIYSILPTLPYSHPPLQSTNTLSNGIPKRDSPVCPRNFPELACLCLGFFAKLHTQTFVNVNDKKVEKKNERKREAQKKRIRGEEETEGNGRKNKH